MKRTNAIAALAAGSIVSITALAVPALASPESDARTRLAAQIMLQQQLNAQAQAYANYPYVPYGGAYGLPGNPIQYQRYHIPGVSRPGNPIHYGNSNRLFLYY